MEPHDYEQLNDYLWGRLSPAEHSAMEARLAAEPALQQALEQERLIQRAVQSMGDIRLKAALRDEERFIRSEAEMRPLWSRLKIAAGLLLLTVFAFLLYNQLRPAATPSLYASYFAPFPNLIAPLDRAEASETDLAISMAAYENGNYEAAALGLDSLRRKTEDPSLDFYQGVSLLASQKYEAALSLFQAVPAQHRFYWESRWYLALAQLARGEQASARPYLQQLQEHAGFKADEARALLKELSH